VAKRDPTWEEAIEQVLRKADGPLHYAAISERILSEGIKSTLGATPAQTVASRLSSSLAKPDSPFLRLAGGVYGLKASVAEEATRTEDATAASDSETGAVRAFGMFWRRENTIWSTKQPRLLGRQGSGASPVDFRAQVGVYLLHDRDRVIYVGRAADTLFARLHAHTVDRLEGRWDRFSWFGLKSVNAEGVLAEASTAWTHTVVIDTMEALLIESLEPPLNRRRGDHFSAVEYQQVRDPEIDQLNKRRVLAEMAAANGIKSI
jgi:hypothetical protein